MSSPTEGPSPYPSPSIVGSRRLTGANLYCHRPGAVLEIALRPEISGLPDRWLVLMREVLPRIGWEHETLTVRYNSARTFVGLFLSAPLDGLLAATEVNEQVWIAAEALADGRSTDLEDLTARLRVFQQHDRRPALMALVQAARTNGLSVTSDDEALSIGTGSGSCTWSLAALPDVERVPWTSLHDIPVALVTGSNGKTTTTRLLAAMLQSSGRTTGWSCTDGLWVNGECIAHGDYAGPAGARTILHDRRVNASVLETARGGILRRGLAADRADVAVVTNISGDHLGEYGVDDLEDLGAAKLVVARAVPSTGHVILNADDAVLRRLAAQVEAPVLWFSVDLDRSNARTLLSSSQDIVWLEDEHVIGRFKGDRYDFGQLAHMPLTLGGQLRYNAANVLAATGAALSLGIDVTSVRDVLATFGALPSHNPGRLVRLSLNDARVVVDFVHNADGWRAMREGFAGVNGRRLVVLGQAGDRGNDALHELAVAVAAFGPDIVVLKEMPKYLRGRVLGEITDILTTELTALGFDGQRIIRAPDELAAVRQVAALALPDDLIVIGAHEDVDAVIRTLRDVGAVDAQWN